jgi:uncharacterized protein YcbX
MIEVASLHVYPVKGLAGVERERLELEVHGPAWDREWMLTDPDGVFVTQREDSRLALLQPEVDESSGVLRLRVREGDPLEVPLAASDRAIREVRVWFDSQRALDEGDAAAAWLEQQLGRPLRLVRVAPDHARAVPAQFTSGSATQRFTDAFPLLITSEAALDDLNAKLGATLEMRRFRPNIVLRGAAAHAEDDWKRIRIGEVDFAFGKRCARCQVTTIDPDTAEIAQAGEPLRTLATYRTLEITNPDGNTERGVFFGANYIHSNSGSIARGDEVEILE